MGKAQGTQTVEQKLDPATQAMQRSIYNAALGASGLPTLDMADQQKRVGTMQKLANSPIGMFSRAGTRLLTQEQQRLQEMQAQAPSQAAQPVPGMSDLTAQATTNYGNAVNAGNLGFRALGGDAAAFSQLHNPFQTQVQDQLAQTYQRALGSVQNATNDAATRAGAFGGSRHGVASGQAMGDVTQDYLSQSANLAYGGFNDTMARAGQMGNMGMQGADAMHQLGEYGRQVTMQQDPVMRQMEILRGAIHGTPYGTTTSQPIQRNVGAGILGGAASGAATGSMFGAPGTAIGAGIGGLLGLFGG